MTEDARRRFESLESLRSAAWTSFDHRRSYEWRFSISLWATLAGAAAAILQLDRAPSGWPPVIVVGAVGLSSSVVHALWSVGVSRVNTIDRDIQIVYEREMSQLVGVSPHEIADIVRSRRPRMGTLSNYSHLSQVVVTATLAAATTAAMWLRAL